MGAVHRHRIVMPLVVVEGVAQCIFLTIGTVFQLITFEADEKLVFSLHIGFLSRAVAEQCTTLLLGLEPEHQRVVLLTATLEELFFQAQALHVALFIPVEFQRHASGPCPAGTMQHQMSTLCQVGSIVAPTLVHRVVVGKSHLIACQQLVAIGVQQVDVHHTIPDTSLQHAALEELTHADIGLLCRAEYERSVAAIGHAVHLRIQVVAE